MAEPQKRKRKPKDRTALNERDNAILKRYGEILETYKDIYRKTYIVELVAKQFFISTQQVYKILRDTAAPKKDSPQQ